MTRPIGRLCTPVLLKLRPGRIQHLLKGASGQAILSGYRPRDCLHSDTISGQRDGAESRAMKTFTIAALILSLLAMPAFAQRRPQGGDDQKSKQDQKPKVDEKAYKAALERIPEPKEKYDPWGVARPADGAKKPK
jgi:hypothetical protein